MLYKIKKYFLTKGLVFNLIFILIVNLCLPVSSSGFRYLLFFLRHHTSYSCKQTASMNPTCMLGILFFFSLFIRSCR